MLTVGVVIGACSNASATVTPTGEAPPVPIVTAKKGTEQQWQQTVDDAKKEGRVTVYTALGPDVRLLVAKSFAKKFGFEPEFVLGMGAETVEKVLAEQRAGLHIADVFIQGAGSLLSYFKPNGLLRPIEPALILPEVVQPGAWVGGRFPVLDKDRTIIAFIASYRDFAFYNTDVVKEGEIKSYQDILDPKWKGRIAMYDPTLSGSGSQWLTFLAVNVWDEQRATEYMRQLAKQEPAFTRDRRLQVEWVARGKYPLGVASDLASTADFIAMGAPVAWAKNLKEGGQIAPGAGCLGLPVVPGHPNAAVVFANWLLTKEGQQVLVDGLRNPSARIDVATTGVDPNSVAQPGQKVYLTDEEYFLAQTRIIDLAKQIFGTK